MGVSEYKLRKIIREEVASILEPFISNTPPKMLNPKQVAEVLDVSLETLKSWRYHGKGPAYCKPGGVMYKTSDIRAYIESTRIKTSEA